ncbi:hypothetical protein BKA80DRAFT_114259 [Phyllosticta citrichinensis]
MRAPSLLGSTSASSAFIPYGTVNTYLPTYLPACPYTTCTSRHKCMAAGREQVDRVCMRTFIHMSSRDDAIYRTLEETGYRGKVGKLEDRMYVQCTRFTFYVLRIYMDVRYGTVHEPLGQDAVGLLHHRQRRRTSPSRKLAISNYIFPASLSVDFPFFPIPLFPRSSPVRNTVSSTYLPACLPARRNDTSIRLWIAVAEI